MKEDVMVEVELKFGSTKALLQALRQALAELEAGEDRE
jgi:hypothetical protein